MKVKWGIIGTGNIADTFANEFDFVDNGTIIAVASRKQQRADEFAEKHDIKKSYQGYEMLAKDNEIDIVYIATPHNFHYENTLLCLENNKAVLCEKPIAVNTGQTIDMIKVAKNKNLFLMEAMWTYFLPAIQKVAEWIVDGKIGQPKYLTANFGFQTEVNPDNRLFSPDLAGGALLDVGIYPISLANLLLSGTPVEIKAESSIGTTGIDEYDSIILRYDKGEIAHISTSIRADFKDDANIYGTDGSIHIPQFWKADRAILDNKDGRKIYEDKRKSTGYSYEINEVNRNILSKNKESRVMTHQKSIDNINVLDNIREIIGLSYPFEN
ncbi:MAG: Gfo/Idh/MocA family protein [bacterium]